MKPKKSNVLEISKPLVNPCLKRAFFIIHIILHLKKKNCRVHSCKALLLYQDLLQRTAIEIFGTVALPLTKNHPGHRTQKLEITILMLQPIELQYYSDSMSSDKKKKSLSEQNRSSHWN